MRYPKCAMILVVIAVAGISRPGYAQLPKTRPLQPGGLSGDVVNSKGVPVSRASIVWQSSDGSKPRALHTDSQGHFSIPNLRSGLYELRASRGQSESVWVHNVLVRPGAPTAVTLRLVTAAPAAPARPK